MSFDKAEYYENRELSWLEFNMRVLSEARDKNNPLLERLKFLSITASNLDEFFMVRVASLMNMMEAGINRKDIAGMKPEEQLRKITEKAHEFVEMQYSTYNRSLLPQLVQNNVRILDGHEDLSDEQRAFVEKYFEEEVYPVLTPMAVDSSRPFPLIRNKSLNIGALIREKNPALRPSRGEKVDKNDKTEKNDKAKGKNSAKADAKIEFATVQVPSVLRRVVELPARKSQSKDQSQGVMREFLLLEEVIEMNIDKLFLNYDVICAYPYRIMRNSDFEIDEEETEDLLSEIQRQLKKRQRGEAIKFETEEKIDKRLLKILTKNLDINEEEIYYVNGPLDLTFLMKLYGQDGLEHLKAQSYVPQPCKMLNDEEDIFTQIRRQDILLHHPYETFEPVMELIRQAANDEKVLAIKMTLYRVSGHSPIISALAQAAENGKQVTVLVELKARFDEENNIIWAKQLEKAGCHVIYGLVGLKTHSKITLIVRKEEDGIVRYVHLGTGNYNDATAKLYTDVGLLTASEPIGEDATAVFNMISGYSEPPVWNRLALAPIWLRERFENLIRREIKNAKAGKEARIVAKMNSLCDKEMIALFYEASAAGVTVQLIVRGICCLIPGITGVSENIQVHSIVGNFLEHSRIYYFANGGHPEIYCASADMMPRNLDKRVEILFPVEQPNLKDMLWHILETELADNVKSHIKQTDGSYVKVDRRGKVAVNSQEQFCEEAKATGKKTAAKEKKRVFVPRVNKN